MMYFPVSPVAPPNKTTFDFDTMERDQNKDLNGNELTLSDRVSESCERNLAEDFYFLHILLFEMYLNS
jgi:hypothetical protein